MWIFVSQNGIQKNNFQIFVTHDVDQPSRYSSIPRILFLKRLISQILIKKEISALIKAPYIRLNSNSNFHDADPYNSFKWLMDLSDELKIKSTFNFMDSKLDNKYDVKYLLKDIRIRNLIKEIHSRGHIIGIHPRYTSFGDRILLKKQFINLRKIINQENIYQENLGGRMHYLRWKWPDTPSGLAFAGLDYDSTLGYCDKPGFRCGTCHSYKMFDAYNQKILNIYQKPLIFMECSLVSSNYMGLGYSKKAYDYISELKERCKMVDGEFTILWHNSHLNSEEDKNMYRYLIQ